MQEKFSWRHAMTSWCHYCLLTIFDHYICVYRTIASKFGTSIYAEKHTRRNEVMTLWRPNSHFGWFSGHWTCFSSDSLDIRYTGIIWPHRFLLKKTYIRHNEVIIAILDFVHFIGLLTYNIYSHVCTFLW